jgi:hypothetical protein
MIRASDENWMPFFIATAKITPIPGATKIMIIHE